MTHSGFRLIEPDAAFGPGARRTERLEALAAQIAAAGGEAVFASVDVSRRDDVPALVQLALDRFGRLDVLINNAGVMPISPLHGLRVEDWEAMIDVNIKGVLYGIVAALPVFRAQKSGHIINTASTAALKVAAEHVGVLRHEDGGSCDLGRPSPGGRS